MADPRFPKLFSPLTLRGVTIKNRIFSTGHDTNLAAGGLINDRLVAYHRARAAGGAGLLIIQVSGVHETARYTSHLLMATTDDSIPGYRRVAEACHAHGCRVFGQLFHPGREIMETQDGSLPVAYAPSAVAERALPCDAGAADPPADRRDRRGLWRRGAARMAAAGIDGVEIVASHGYLPAQFLNPRVNRREDELWRQLREPAALPARGRSPRPAPRSVPTSVVGMRISGAEMDHDGLTEEEVLEACRALGADGELDYYNVIAGTSASFAGAIHIVPPMAIEHALCGAVRRRGARRSSTSRSSSPAASTSRRSPSRCWPPARPICAA